MTDVGVFWKTIINVINVRYKDAKEMSKSKTMNKDFVPFLGWVIGQNSLFKKFPSIHARSWCVYYVVFSTLTFMNNVP